MSGWRCMPPNTNAALACLLPRQERQRGRPGRARGRASVRPRISAAQGREAQMLPCHHKLCEDEWPGRRGLPKIGWNCPRPESKWPQFQYEKTVFLTCISARPRQGDASSADRKHSVLGLWNWKLLFHQGTKMQRNLHESGASGLRDLPGRKYKWARASHVRWGDTETADV